MCQKSCHMGHKFEFDVKMCESIFYKKAADYWSNVPATIDGVLGGFGQISDTDIEGPKAFLHKILTRQNPPSTNLALDCGAGIGRITEYLLMPCFEMVELVEQNEQFINTAKQLLADDNKKLGTIYKIGLQHFKPLKKYNVIWCQWVLGHLNDYDLISFLDRCDNALSNNGVVIVKENITVADELEYDDEDSSVTRPYYLLKRIFNEAKLQVIEEDVQIGFTADIYPVHSFALIPAID